MKKFVWMLVVIVGCGSFAEYSRKEVEIRMSTERIRDGTKMGDSCPVCGHRYRRNYK